MGDAPPPDLTPPDAYDAIAAQYDTIQAGDEWMRRRLHQHYLRAFQPGQRVLDIGCGTGTDALFLTRYGIHVLGIDGSPGMIARLRAKASLEARVLAIEDLASLDDRFDGAYSSFASLSTVDLDRFARDVAGLLEPGAPLIVHLLNRFSLWERRMSPPRRTFVIGGRPIEHRMYFPDEAVACFASGFVLNGVYSLGSLRPPHTVRRVPRRVVHGLEWLDVRLGGLPGLRDAGRFFVLDLRRRPGPSQQPHDQERAAHA